MHIPSTLYLGIDPMKALRIHLSIEQCHSKKGQVSLRLPFVGLSRDNYVTCCVHGTLVLRHFSRPCIRQDSMGFNLRWLFSRKNEKGPKSVNIFVGAFFMVNYCLGTGFLGVPFSFFYSGYLAAIPTLLLIAFVSWNNAEWKIETMARAQVSILAHG